MIEKSKASIYNKDMDQGKLNEVVAFQVNRNVINLYNRRPVQ